jgi:hypothetical protein
MCLTRIYVRRRRDGTLMRFNSKHALVSYSREQNESRRTLPTITRTEFIQRKNEYRCPTWIRSTRHEGMALLADRG